MENPLNPVANTSEHSVNSKRIRNLQNCNFRFLYEDDEESMSLVIKNVQPVDAGAYLVSAENELGSDSAEMTLTVKGEPNLLN